MQIQGQDYQILQSVYELGSGYCSGEYLLLQNKNKEKFLAYEKRIVSKESINSAIESAEDAISSMDYALSIINNKYQEKDHDISYRGSNKNIILSNGEYNLLNKFDVYYTGWECDGEGFVVEDVNTKKQSIMLSNHGSLYIASIQELNSMLAEYKDIYKQTKQLFEQLQ